MLALEQASLGWSWSALLDSQVKLNSINIAGLAFDVERGPGERLVTAGIDLEKEGAENEPETATADSEPLAWSIALQQLSLQNFKLCYLALPKHDFCNHFETLSWNGDISLDLASLSEPTLPLKVAGDFRLVNLKTHDNRLGRGMIGFDEFMMQEVRVDSLNDIAIKSITLDALTLFERPADPEHASITRLKSIQLEQLGLAKMSNLDIAEVKLQGHEALIVSLSSN